ncbi:MAG: adenylate/guanylate cyclase domain-containing protein [Spirochaetes bacterium]|nr:adenylate/guanylate cyclase domain-containing protein [Spirochaetota bacterium]MBU1080145.1 adenylate/guanylate cyclase domain-containing protein [Spirochaetota bacterium]
MMYQRSIAVGASEDRLSRLISERMAPGADKERIDARIWDLFGEEWAIVFTDLAGFSRKVEAFGIIHFLQTIYESERILVPVIDDHDGVLLKIEGDSMMIIFRNTIKALKAVKGMQAACKEYNEGKPEEDRVLLCAGIGFGRVLRIGDSDVFGREVNSASKLGEDTARAGEILVTQGVVDAVPFDAGFRFSELESPPAAVGKAYRFDYA